MATEPPHRHKEAMAAQEDTGRATGSRRRNTNMGSRRRNMDSLRRNMGSPRGRRGVTAGTGSIDRGGAVLGIVPCLWRRGEGMGDDSMTQKSEESGVG